MLSVERQILEVLGHHERITNYLGPSHEPNGLLFMEASHGDLQQHLDDYFPTIDLNVHLRWCLEAAEAIEYIHSKGVLHRGIAPANFLLHQDSLQLCGFADSHC